MAKSFFVTTKLGTVVGGLFVIATIVIAESLMQSPITKPLVSLMPMLPVPHKRGNADEVAADVHEQLQRTQRLFQPAVRVGHRE